MGNETHEKDLANSRKKLPSLSLLNTSEKESRASEATTQQKYTPGYEKTEVRDKMQRFRARSKVLWQAKEANAQEGGAEPSTQTPDTVLTPDNQESSSSSIEDSLHKKKQSSAQPTGGSRFEPPSEQEARPSKVGPLTNSNKISHKDARGDGESSAICPPGNAQRAQMPYLKRNITQQVEAANAPKERVLTIAKLQEKHLSLPATLGALEDSVNFFASMNRGDETLAKDNIHKKVMELVTCPRPASRGDEAQAIGSIVTLARICTKLKILGITELKLNRVFGELIAIFHNVISDITLSTGTPFLNVFRAIQPRFPGSLRQLVADLVDQKIPVSSIEIAGKAANGGDKLAASEVETTMRPRAETDKLSRLRARLQPLELEKELLLIKIRSLEAGVKASTATQQPMNNPASHTNGKNPSVQQTSKLDFEDLDAYLVSDHEIESEGEPELGGGYLSIDTVMKPLETVSSKGGDPVHPETTGATNSEPPQSSLSFHANATDTKNKPSHTGLQDKANSLDVRHSSPPDLGRKNENVQSIRGGSSKTFPRIKAVVHRADGFTTVEVRLNDLLVVKCPIGIVKTEEERKVRLNELMASIQRLDGTPSHPNSAPYPHGKLQHDVDSWIGKLEAARAGGEEGGHRAGKWMA